MAGVAASEPGVNPSGQGPWGKPTATAARTAAGSSWSQGPDSVFDVTEQARHYDRDGAYVRQWVPELRKVPAAHVHEPGAMTAVMQQATGCVVGRDYPQLLTVERDQVAQNIQNAGDIAQSVQLQAPAPPPPVGMSRAPTATGRRGEGLFLSPQARTVAVQLGRAPVAVRVLGAASQGGRSRGALTGAQAPQRNVPRVQTGNY